MLVHRSGAFPRTFWLRGVRMKRENVMIHSCRCQSTFWSFRRTCRVHVCQLRDSGGIYFEGYRSCHVQCGHFEQAKWPRHCSRNLPQVSFRTLCDSEGRLIFDWCDHHAWDAREIKCWCSRWVAARSASIGLSNRCVCFVMSRLMVGQSGQQSCFVGRVWMKNS